MVNHKGAEKGYDNNKQIADDTKKLLHSNPRAPASIPASSIEMLAYQYNRPNRVPRPSANLGVRKEEYRHADNNLFRLECRCAGSLPKSRNGNLASGWLQEPFAVA